MILPLSLLLLATTPPPAVAQSDPAVKVWLADDRIEPGTWARVKARLADDGYLLVLTADPQGNVRVLFPLDPGADAFVRAGRTVDLRGRGGRGSFLVGEAGGAGVVLAARTAEPLRFTGFVQGDHWDYAALDSAAHDSTAGQGVNPDEMLLGLAQQIAGGNQLDYDAATYTVSGGLAAGDRPYIHQGYGPAWDYGYVYPSWYGCYDPWFCGPGFFTGFSFGVFFSPFAYRPFIYGPFGRRPIVRGYPRVARGYAVGGYRDRRYIASPRPASYHGRGAATAGARAYGGARAGRSFAPRFSGPRMAMPSFRGRGGGGGGRRGR